MSIELTEEQKEYIENVMSHFEPMTEEEQKLFLFMCLLSICDLENKKPKSRTIKVEIETYDMMTNLFTKSEVVNTKSFMLHNIVKKDYDKFYEKVEIC